MTEKTSIVDNTVRGKLRHCAEERAAATLDTEETRKQIQKHGHKGILTMDQESKMETVSTMKADFVAPKSAGVRLRGIRTELMEKHAQLIREKFHAEQNQPIPKTDFSSTTQRDFSVEGFVPLTPESKQVHDYKTEQAVTFWSENYQQIQGVTPARSQTTPFRKSALFSTPIRERLDEIELPSDN